KAAALMYYADNLEWPVGTADLKGYLDRDPTESSKIASYDVVSDEVSADLAIRVSIIAEKGIQDRLADMAAESGLYTSDLESEYQGGEGPAYMIIAR
ncbi:MAG TPA: hypothetical protein PLS21_08250, partial [Synergistales bacterium]|nr:hypothetical protein [Synergistales bacterium]